MLYLHHLGKSHLLYSFQRLVRHHPFQRTEPSITPASIVGN